MLLVGLWLLTPASDSLLLASLSPQQVSRYQQQLAAAEHGALPDAEALAGLDPVWQDELFARAVRHGFEADGNAISAWLARNPDHPAASEMAAVARQRGLRVEVAGVKALRGEGYAQHLGRRTMPEAWYRGLRLWREGKYASAAEDFKRTAEEKGADEWQQAAGYFWAHRALAAAGESQAARRDLANAAQFPETFYGLLARAQRGDDLPRIEPPAVPHRLAQADGVTRARIFKQLGRDDDAEAELRALYNRIDPRERAGLVTVAAQLDLTSLQLRLAAALSQDETAARFAGYPVPAAFEHAQLDAPAPLLLSIARTESGFREDTVSHAGARGIMQMMPATAAFVSAQLAARDGSDMALSRLSDPLVSVRYAAEYLNMLAREPAVKGDLVRLIAAYNAGPGNVANWQSLARNIEDPLLYIEMIPFAETRNYVTQVLTHSWLYSALMKERPDSLYALAEGQWPAYEAPAPAAAAARL